MKISIIQILAAFLVVGLCSHIVFSQDLKAKAEEHPLATVFYLLSKTAKDSKEEQKTCLAKSFARAEKFSEIEKTAEMVETESYADKDFLELTRELINAGRIAEASTFVSYLLKRFDDDSTMLKELLKLLVRLGRDDEALKIAGQFDEAAKVDAVYRIAEEYLELKKPAKALALIENISETVEKSKYERDKAKLALFYAGLGKADRSLKLSHDALQKVVWTTGIPEYEHGRVIDDIFEAYLLLGKYDLADEMLKKQGKTEDAESLIRIAQSRLAKGDRQKADELLNRAQTILNPNDYGDSFDLGDLIEIYLDLGEIEKTQSLAKGLNGSEYMRQQKLLKVADFYIKKRDRRAAFEILNFALEQTKKIKTDEAESGLQWTSGKWNQAQYQSQIAIRLIDMQSDKQALELIAQIKKPYLKALLLTEFFAANKKRLPPAKLRAVLQDALQLLRSGKEEIFDSKKYDVYSIVARSFAEIAMTDKASEVFAEVLAMDREMVEKGLDDYLLIAMCKIGVEFEKSGIKPNEKLKSALRSIIKNWEAGAY